MNAKQWALVFYDRKGRAKKWNSRNQNIMKHGNPDGFKKIFMAAEDKYLKNDLWDLNKPY